jgi:hypothetical protein
MHHGVTHVPADAEELGRLFAAARTEEWDDNPADERNCLIAARELLAHLDTQISRRLQDVDALLSG